MAQSAPVESFMTSARFEDEAAYEFDLSLIIIASNTVVDLEAFTEMIDGYRKVFHESNLKAEFIVVDDGVGGRFHDTLIVLNREVHNFRVVQFRRTFGESVALRIAAERARGEIIITNTWYLQVKPDAAIEAIKRLRSGADLVAGRRSPRVDSKLAQLQSWGFNKLTQFLTKVEINDLNCSFRAFKRDVIDSIHFHGDLFRFVPVLAVGQGFLVEEIDVRHVAEKGPSTFGNLNLYVRRVLDIFTLFFLLKFIKKPLRFFGLTGLALFAVGFAVSAWVAYERIADRTGAADRPVLILGVFFMVLGPIVLSIGLIGEIIIFTQGRALNDYHVAAVLGGNDDDDDDDEGQHDDDQN